MADDFHYDTGVGCKRIISDIVETETLLLQQPELSNSVLPVNSQDDSREKHSSLASSSSSSSSSKEVIEIVQELPSPTSSKKFKCFFTAENQEMLVSIGEEKAGSCDLPPGSFGSRDNTEDCGRKIGNSGEQLRETKDSVPDLVSGSEQKNLVLKSGKGKQIVCDTNKEFDGGRVLPASKSTEVCKGSHIREKKGFFRIAKREAENVFEAKKKQVLEKFDALGFNTAAGILGSLKGIDEAIRRSLKVEVIDDIALIATVSVPKTGKRFVKATGRNGKKNEKQEGGGKKAKRPRRKGKDGRKDLGTCKEVENGGKKKKAHIGKRLNGTNQTGEVEKKGVNGRKYSREEMEALRFMNTVGQENLWSAVYAGLGDVVAKEYKDLECSRDQKNSQLKCDPCQLIGRRENASGILGVAVARKRLNHVNITVR